MVQEFHVLRCFSCQTFQVQQVKKSKKWSCKMCGEKQSLIKEYGRGTGADCRRHVQKLNSLRGELLEIENEKAWTQWEKQECEVEVSPGDESQSWEQKGDTQIVSRWNKYMDQKESGPECEEKNIYTGTEKCSQHHNIRKRKKSFTPGASCKRYTVGGDEDIDTAHCGVVRLPSQPHQHDGTFKSLPHVSHTSTGFPCAHTSQRNDALCHSPAAYNGICSQSTEAKKQSFADLSTKPHPLVPLSSFFAPSVSHGQPTATKPEARDSKWAQFLPSVCAEAEEGDGEGAQYTGAEHSALAQSLVMPVATVLFKNIAGTEGLGLDKVFGVEKGTISQNLSHCVTGNMCKQPNSPTLTSRPAGSQKPVCVQPVPLKRPCPALSFSTLFHTDEDFDDAY
ncbi:MRN complex-interacting protein isoform X2 [Neoarius graeffei]|uniref:MRN complex-interacting protein isoform X2 n=1 Tax=Neoarius graeffei TaxID=443677 RepID=UPI00298BD903|nr:MRN complex-interacting protein isoform X2 [Neoarius graeffei]